MIHAKSGRTTRTGQLQGATGRPPGSPRAPPAARRPRRRRRGRVRSPRRRDACAATPQACRPGGQAKGPRPGCARGRSAPSRSDGRGAKPNRPPRARAGWAGRRRHGSGAPACAAACRGWLAWKSVRPAARRPGHRVPGRGDAAKRRAGRCAAPKRPPHRPAVRQRSAENRPGGDSGSGVLGRAAPLGGPAKASRPKSFRTGCGDGSTSCRNRDRRRSRTAAG